MKKDLAAAHLLAAQNHDLDYYRDALRTFQDEKVAWAAEKAAEAEEKAIKKAATKAKPRSKSLSNTVVNDDEDIEMADVTMDAESDGADTEEAVVEKPKKTKKRKAEDDAAVSQANLITITKY